LDFGDLDWSDGEEESGIGSWRSGRASDWRRRTRQALNWLKDTKGEALKQDRSGRELEE